MAIRRIFGLNVETDYPFETPLPFASGASGAPDLAFTFRPPEPGRPVQPEGPPSVESPVRLDGGAPLFALYHHPGGHLLRFTEVADFILGEKRITCHLLDPAYAYMVEVHLLGIVFAFWFEERGVPMLHASAVSVDGTALVFMATNKGGKSSLAGAFMQLGFPLLSDDLVGLEASSGDILARPGFPSMRLWPDQAAHFLGDWRDLALAHPRVDKRRVSVGPEGFGTFVDAPHPMGGIYLPQRVSQWTGARPAEITPLSQREGVMELVRGSFLPRVVHAAGQAPHRLNLFSRLVASVPVKRLRYVEGVSRLPEVCDELLKDLRESRGATRGGDL